MNICLVTAFPPSREALNEYGFHIARELQSIPGLTVTILGDDLPHPQPELQGFNVVRCWAFNSVRNPVRLLRAIRHCQPDVVWFNLGFASFGGKPLPAFVGIGIPALARLAGFYTHVTLHQLMETVDLKDAGVRFRSLYKVAGFMATQLLLFANSISVLLPAYRSLIRDKYRRGSVYVRKHGILSGRPEYPAFEKRGNPNHRVLAFGKWGTYKRLEPMMEAFEVVAGQVPNVELIIAGTDHPKALGYLQSVAERCKDRPHIRFAGYVPEDKISDLFQSISVAVMPYTSSAGSSGVAHLACAYGVPIVASDIQDFRQLVEEEHLAIDLYQTGNMQSFAEKLIDLLESPERQMDMAMQNFSAALRMSMPEIIKQYLRTFHLQRELGMLASISRMRKLPRWLPLRERLLRAAARKRLARLSASAPPMSFDLLDSESDAGGTVLRSRVPVDGNGESAGPRSSGSLSSRTRSTSAGAENAEYYRQTSEEKPLADLLPRIPTAGNGNGHHPQAGEQEATRGVIPFSRMNPQNGGGNGAGRNGNHGSSGAAPGSDAGGRERTERTSG